LEYRFSREKCLKLKFSPIEFVSPIFNMETGLEDFSKEFTRLLDDSFVYTTNKTCGLHVNVSHPNLKPARFVKIWCDYEPIIFNLISIDRRFENRPTWNGNMKKTMERVLYDPNKDRDVISVRSDRIEIRIFDSTMDVSEIQNWILFCVTLVGISTILERRHLDVYDYSFESNRIKYVHEFLELFDNNLKHFILKKYRDNCHSEQRHYKDRCDMCIDEYFWPLI